jgi:hypothetical protein
VAKHDISVSSVYWGGGYAVKCSSCGKLGRGVDKDRKKARENAWNIGQRHRAGKNGATWLGS